MRKCDLCVNHCIGRSQHTIEPTHLPLPNRAAPCPAAAMLLSEMLRLRHDHKGTTGPEGAPWPTRPRI